MESLNKLWFRVVCCCQNLLNQLWLNRSIIRSLPVIFLTSTIFHSVHTLQNLPDPQRLFISPVLPYSSISRSPLCTLRVCPETIFSSHWVRVAMYLLYDRTPVCSFASHSCLSAPGTNPLPSILHPSLIKLLDFLIVWLGTSLSKDFSYVFGPWWRREFDIAAPVWVLCCDVGSSGILDSRMSSCSFMISTPSPWKSLRCFGKILCNYDPFNPKLLRTYTNYIYYMCACLCLLPLLLSNRCWFVYLP